MGQQAELKTGLASGAQMGLCPGDHPPTIQMHASELSPPAWLLCLQDSMWCGSYCIFFGFPDYASVALGIPNVC